MDEQTIKEQIQQMMIDTITVYDRISPERIRNMSEIEARIRTQSRPAGSLIDRQDAIRLHHAWALQHGRYLYTFLRPSYWWYRARSETSISPFAPLTDAEARFVRELSGKEPA